MTNDTPVRNLTPCKSCCDGSFVFLKQQSTGEVRLVCYSCYISYACADAIMRGEPIGHIVESDLTVWSQASMRDVESACLVTSIDDMT